MNKQIEISTETRLSPAWSTAARPRSPPCLLHGRRQKAILPRFHNVTMAKHPSLHHHSPFTHSSPLDPDTLNRPYPRQCKWSLNYSIFPYLSLGTCPLYLLSLFLPPSPGVEEGKAEGRFARPLHVFISMYMLIFFWGGGGGGLRSGVSFYLCFSCFCRFYLLASNFLKSQYTARNYRPFGDWGSFSFSCIWHLAAFDTIGIFFSRQSSSVDARALYFCYGGRLVRNVLSFAICERKREKKEQKGRTDSKKGALPD